MSTLKTNNIEHLDASTPSIQTTIGGGTILAGVSTVSGTLNVGSGTSISSPATNTLALGTNGTEKLRITSAGSVGIGTDDPSAKLHVEGISSIATTLDTGGILLSDTTTKTYPTSSSFNVTAGTNINLELGTTQTVDTSTPGGFNFVTADKRTYTKSAGTTSDIERLYFAGFNQLFRWADANTCKQYVGFNDTFSYSGINANGRTSSSFNASSITLNPPDGGTQTIANVTSPSLRASPTGTSTINITNCTSYSPQFRFFNSSTGTKTVNITNASYYDTSQYWGTAGSTGTLNATITNLYGLRLRPPNSSTGLTVTNNYGVYQEWSDANNYFAGNIQMGAGKGIDFSATSDGSGTATSELLDDYEEGTWTPTLGGTATYSTQQGFYTKIGNIVTVTFYLVVSAIGTGSSRIVAGLPYSATTSTGGGPVAYWNNTSQNMVYCSMYSYNNNSLAGYIATSAVSSLTTGSIFQTGTALQACIQYRAA